MTISVASIAGKSQQDQKYIVENCLDLEDVPQENISLIVIVV